MTFIISKLMAESGFPKKPIDQKTCEVLIRK